MSIFQSNPSRAAARSFTLLALISAAFNISAQTAPTSDNMLPPVVVTASRIEQPQTDALPHTTVISAEAIHNNPSADLPALLQREAGIQFTQNGGPGQTGSLFMRGVQPSETLILVDGVPVRRQGFASAPALEHILPEQIDRIEIVRGNVSAIYGSSAIGGVIQIFTKRGASQPAFSASTEVGSRGTRRLSGGVSGKSGDTRYALSLTRFTADAFSANNVAQYPNENPDDDGYRNTSVAGSVSHEWTKNHEIGMRFYSNEGKFDFDSGGFGAPTDINTGRSKQQSLSVFSKDRMTSNWSSTVTASQIATRNDNLSIAAFGYDIRDRSNTTLLQWANEVSLAPGWSLVAGADAGRERLDASADYGFGATNAAYSRTTSSLYTGVNGKIDAHQLQANIRYDRIGGSGSDVTGFLGYGFSVTSDFKLIGSVSTAFNAPNLTQLYDPLSGNTALKSEHSKSYELGAQYLIGASIVRATFFKTRTDNQFAVDPNNCFGGAYLASCPTFNIAQGSNQGLELSASGRVAGLDVRTALTVQHPKNDATGDILIRRAKTLASLSLSKSFGDWRVGTDVQYTGSRPDTDFVTASKKELSSYWLANLNARYQINKTTSVYGRIENAFDRDYQTTYGTNQPPRGIFVGLSWQQ